jgi:hypothetical protein
LVDDHEADTDHERPSFTAKVMGSLASVGGFYGKVVQSGPELPPEVFVEEPIDAEPVAEIEPEPEIEPADETQPIEDPAVAVEGNLQNKLSDVRALAEEAREAQVRSNQALYAGLSAAYDFALDAEDAPEDYLRLVEAQGLKIQLRSPMKPVVRLAFEGQCDEPTIPQLEAVLAWALKQDLPRGSLAERIQAEGGPELRYLGQFHFARETGHAMHGMDHRILESISLSQLERVRCLDLSFRVFDLFADWTTELLAYAKNAIARRPPLEDQGTPILKGRTA